MDRYELRVDDSDGELIQAGDDLQPLLTRLEDLKLADNGHWVIVHNSGDDAAVIVDATSGAIDIGTPDA